MQPESVGEVRPARRMGMVDARKVLRFRFRAKLFLAFVLYAILLLAATLLLVQTLVSQQSRRNVRSELQAALSAGVSRLDAATVVAAATGEEAVRRAAVSRIRTALQGINQNAPSAEPDSNTVALLVQSDQPRYLRVLDAISEGPAVEELELPGPLPTLDDWRSHIAEAMREAGLAETDLFAFRTITDATGVDRAILVAAAPESAITTNNREYALVAGIIFVLSLLASCFPAIFIAARLNRPVDRLSAAMEAVARGEIDTSVRPVSSGDELELLMHRFNEMIEGLRERRALRQSLQLGHDVQQHLLPMSPPRLATFDLAGLSLYCEQMGGDYLDYLDVGDGRRWAVVVGDVSGHGVAAATLMASARAVLRSTLPQTGTDLAALLETLNDHLSKDFDASHFMTLALVVLDTEAGSIAWATAGHDPPILAGADGTLEQLQGEGPALGIIEDAGFSAFGPRRLRPDDTLLLTTDGVWETLSPEGEQFGQQRLLEILAETRGQSAEHAANTVRERVAAFSGNATLRDDLTLAVIRRREQAEPGETRAGGDGVPAASQRDATASAASEASAADA